MPSGRPRQPSNVQDLNGTRNSRRRSEPVPVGGFSRKAPRNLDPAERKHWDRVVPELESMRVVTSADAQTVLAYVEALAMRDQALKEIKAHKRKRGTIMAEGANGQMIQHPAIRVHREYASLADKFGQSLGMTPRGRAELAVPSAGAGPTSAAARLLS